MEIDCPKCGHTNVVEGEDLPANACDNISFECSDCGHDFNIGWYPEVEVR